MATSSQDNILAFRDWIWIFKVTALAGSGCLESIIF